MHNEEAHVTCTLHQILLGDEIKENEVDEARNMQTRKMRNAETF
jgi:hypothetical protein